MAPDIPEDQLASRLLLNIKSLSLLYPSQAALKEVLDRSYVDYSDEHVKRFTDTIRPGHPVSRSSGALVAVGEIVLASFLAILGIGSFVPSMIGVQSPQQFFTYFAGKLSSSFRTGPLAAAASVIDLAFSVVLVISALYLIRRSAVALRESGLVIESSG